jgi:PAS domain S-box-containing protein
MSGDESLTSRRGANRAAPDRAAGQRPAANGMALSGDQIIDGLAEGFFALDSNWRFVAFNRAAEGMFEIAREEVLGKLLWEVSPAILGTEFDRRYRLAMGNREEQEFESYSILRPDRYHEVRAFPLGDGIGVAFRDATERQNILEKLRRRELELARVQEIGGVGGMRVDLAGGFTGYRSPEYLRLHGLPPDAGVETHEDWMRRIHPDDRSRTVEHFLRAVASGATRYGSEYRIVRPSDGAVRWIRAVGEIERDENAAPIALVGAHIDITDRKLAEQDALESEQKLRAIADALPVLISYVDKDQIFRFVNKAYEDWFERPLSAILGRRVKDVMSRAMYEARRPYLERALAGETVSYEVDFVRSSGATATQVIHVPHRDSSGRTLGVYVVVSDISERKLAERRIAESEARFRSIANSAPVLIWVTGPDGKREFVNQAYLDFVGLTYADALDFDWRRALHPDDLPRVLANEPVVEPSVRIVTVEARFRRHDGEWRWLRSESQPRWGAASEHLGFIGVAHDVTEAKKAQEELSQINQTLERRVAERTAQLAASEALVRSFFEHSSECHAIMVENDGGFRYQEVNPALLRLYGMDRREVVGRRTEEVLGPEMGAEVNRHLAQCLREGGSRRYERMQGAAVVEAVATALPPREGEARRIIVSARDVTERRRLEEHLRQSQKMEALGQLTGGVAHDFNNMLTLVLGGLDTIDRQLGSLPDSPAAVRIRRAKDMALQGMQRAQALTDRLLAFSRQQALAPRAVNANTLVAGICDLLQRTLGEQIVLETALADGLWNAFVDPNQLENALINLALNARDAMPRGGKLLIQTANRFLDAAFVGSLPERIEPGEYVMIAVADTGVGMDETTRKRAFDPFFTTKEIGKGTGLGLSQVYGFTRQSSGQVQIESELDRGTAVKIYLPRQSGAAADVKDDRRKPVTRPVARESVLVVEDDDAVRAYTAEILRDLGYSVTEAASAKAALAILETARPFDLLLTDVVMPGDMNGRELADEAVRLRDGLRVLFMTGYSRDAIIRDGRVDPRVHVIGKPFSFDDLAAKVRERLDASA